MALNAAGCVYSTWHERRLRRVEYLRGDVCPPLLEPLDVLLKN
jgi:hypothetical protein